MAVSTPLHAFPGINIKQLVRQAPRAIDPRGMIPQVPGSGSGLTPLETARASMQQPPQIAAADAQRFPASAPPQMPVTAPNAGIVPPELTAEQPESAGGPLSKLFGRFAPNLQEGGSFGPNARLAMAAGLLGGGSTSKAIGRAAENLVGFRAQQAAAAAKAASALTFDQRKQLALLGADRTESAIPKDHRAIRDASGFITRYEVIPDSPTAREQAAAEAKEGVAQATAMREANILGRTTGSIIDIFDNHDKWGIPLTGTMSNTMAKHSGTDQGKIRSYVRTLQSSTALDTMLKLKEASSTGATGFGALQKVELELIIAAVGPLDPATTDPEVFYETVKDIDARLQRQIAILVENTTLEERAAEGLLGLTGEAAPDGLSAAEIATAKEMGFVPSPDGNGFIQSPNGGQ